MAESAGSATAELVLIPIGVLHDHPVGVIVKSQVGHKLPKQFIAGHRAVRLLQQIYQHIIGYTLPVGVADTLEFLQSDLSDIPRQKSDHGTQMRLRLEKLGLSLA